MAVDEDNFEEPILDLERRIEALSGVGDDSVTQRQREQLQQQLESLRTSVFSNLSPWQKTLVARHPRRPHTLNYVTHLVEDFVEIHGDRKFSDDQAIICGFGRLRGRQVMIVGHQKGRDTKEKIRRNFGMPRPEGYRKALRAMQLAAKYRRPIVSFVDTPGAYPGIGAEERGQAEAIALNLREMARLSVPIVVTVTGEGGSGGALALGVGNKVNILEHATYSVISPEGCAAILWRDPGKNREAAEAMRLTAEDLHKFGVVDEIIPEVNGGAHVDHARQAEILGDVIERQLEEMAALDGAGLTRMRHDRFRRMGVFGVG
ncbi:MAG: acetyl-CoA carboxylase carboxyltransferase subunit alpha [Acidobacteria bacterium]|nr:acetyl-CoA carboxylase carboxyltransferase subunit alpha [Acidobacteriota bacterium]NIM63793.1 acetyl-CoA carboxylase carboxyltransferase subunit alpha [Acidobacteriota bacterium]NIO58456.1 acetyl-CoA carboxylase carboxyltransferase subunit alpha [Acidobacteriota bacterium]NIQ29519.1 acetyl-CoA carboxylase carboxyltransferase subunit alpha [Acidobacteriota bacterium]NIQ84201.1 acetyl-CoA carboxylase carboxyltransferase subunit alpha [Acidobacteriota bacterium]